MFMINYGTTTLEPEPDRGKGHKECSAELDSKSVLVIVMMDYVP